MLAGTAKLVRVTIYTKTGCHLCEVVVAKVEAVRERVPFDLQKIDIRSDPELADKYAFDIPVVDVDGKIQFTNFLNSEQFESKIKEYSVLDAN